MNIYEIRDRALRSGRLVFDYGQLSVLAGIPREQARVYAARLLRKGLAQKALDGRVAFTTDPFVVATQLVEPSYVSMASALYLRRAIAQVPAEVECVTPVKSMAIRFPRISYHRLVPPLFFGFERQERYGGYVFAATVEKAVLDSVYFWGGAPQVEADRAVLKSMARAYGERGGPRGRRVLKWAGSLD